MNPQANMIPKVCRVTGPRWISGCIGGCDLTMAAVPRPIPTPACSSPPTASRAPSPPPRSRRRSPTGSRRPGSTAERLPIADGGEGTLDALLDALGGERRSATVADPLGSRGGGRLRAARRRAGRGRDGAGERALAPGRGRARSVARVDPGNRGADRRRGRGRGAVGDRRRRRQRDRGRRRRMPRGARRGRGRGRDRGGLRRDHGVGGLAARLRAAEGRRPGDGRAARAGGWPSSPSAPRGIRAACR